MHAHTQEKMAALAAMLMLGLVVTATALPRNGLSLGFGAGMMVPVDEDSYLDLGSDFYPELQLSYDIHAVKAGLSIGYNSRSQRTTPSAKEEYELTFIPVEVNAAFLPVRLINQDSFAQPYIGIGLAANVAAGDNDDTYFMLSPHLGIEFHIGRWNILGIDLSYHAVTGEDDEGTRMDYNLDYFTAMAVYRFRIPFESRFPPMDDMAP